jgi:precorrin-2 dehydrogenase/sirohydrochlorin ferrochelatase
MYNYPVNLDLRNRKCVVIGGGGVAERKVETLLDFGGTVVVVSPDLSPRLRELSANKLIEHISEAYEPQCLEQAYLVIAATNDPEVNKAVSLEAQRRRILVNVVDNPELCTFFVPAIIHRGDLVISISTSGKSPALARRIREEMEFHFGPEYSKLTDLLGEFRDEVKAKYANSDERHRAFVRILDSDVLDLLAQNKWDEARRKARQCI